MAANRQVSTSFLSFLMAALVVPFGFGACVPSIMLAGWKVAFALADTKIDLVDMVGARWEIRENVRENIV